MNWRMEDLTTIRLPSGSHDLSSMLRRASLLVAIAFVGGRAGFGLPFTNPPSAVSNTYAGTITLQIGGLTNGETVAVQKFFDANTNGVIDAGDLLVQQFQLTDGQAPPVFNGATNIAVPGD